MKRFLALTTLLILTACTAATVEPVTPTAIPSDTPPPPTVSPTPTRTPFPTWPPPSPTPDFLDSPIANGYLLAPSADPDCKLPCWQGLRIGKSNKEDVLVMFDEVMGITSGFGISPERATRIPGTKAITYLWEVEDTERDILGWLSLYVIFEDETDILKGIRIDTFASGLYEIHTPQQFIRELGTPSAIYAANVSGRMARLMLLYYEGIVSFSVSEASVEEKVVDNETRVVFTYCLNEMPIDREVDIVEPFNDISEASLTPIQNTWFGEYLRAGLYPVEEAFGLTEEEFVAIALDDENPCIELSSYVP